MLSFCAVSAQDQEAVTQAGYLKFPTIPPFTLIGIDSAKFTRDKLAKHKKTMIMIFSPGCDHCRHQTDSMLANMDQLRDVQILMSTYQPFEDMTAFYKDYNLAKYSNIITGRDFQYFLIPFYKVANLPFLVLYNDKGKLITTFEGTTPVDKLLQAFKQPALHNQ